MIDHDAWRRGYDEWKDNAPDVGAGAAWKPESCAVCGSTAISKINLICGNGHTPTEQDAAANAKRGWK